MRSDRSRLAARLLTAFVIGFVSLTLEIAYTRVVSFKLFYYYTYLVIGLALLGLGAASAVVSLSTRLRSLDVLRLVRLVAPAAAMVGLIGYLVVARIPTDTHLIWTSLTTIISMTYGFDRAVLAGLVLYVVATVVLLPRRRHAGTPEPVLTTSADGFADQSLQRIPSDTHR